MGSFIGEVRLITVVSWCELLVYWIRAVAVMALNVTLNNISVILLQSKRGCALYYIILLFLDRYWGYGVECLFQQYFSYIVAVSFIGEGNWSTGWKPPTCRKSLTNFYHIILYQVHLARAGCKLKICLCIGRGGEGGWVGLGLGKKQIW